VDRERTEMNKTPNKSTCMDWKWHYLPIKLFLTWCLTSMCDFLSSGLYNEIQCNPIKPII
jgi:hypothetical protein